jgi:hypothetical protein
MGITLPTTFVSGTARTGSSVNGNLEACRRWLNGRIATTDIVNAQLSSQALLRPEHYGSPLYASLGTCADVWGDSADMTPKERAIFSYQIGGGDYHTVPGLARTIRIQNGRTAWVEIMARYFAYVQTQASGLVGGPGSFATVAMVALYIDGSIVNHTTTRITMNDLATTPNYYHREYAVVHAAELSNGEHDIHVRARTVSDVHVAPGPCPGPLDATTGANAGWLVGYPETLNIQARSVKIEVNYIT